MTTDSRLFIYDMIVDMNDIQMMMLGHFSGADERTKPQWQSLVEAAGLTMRKSASILAPPRD